MIEANLYHDSLIILESLKEDDKKTGKIFGFAILKLTTFFVNDNRKLTS